MKRATKNEKGKNGWKTMRSDVILNKIYTKEAPSTTGIEPQSDLCDYLTTQIDVEIAFAIDPLKPSNLFSMLGLKN